MHALRLAFAGRIALNRVTVQSNQNLGSVWMSARSQPVITERFFTTSAPTETTKDSSEASEENLLKENVNVPRRLVKFIIGPKGQNLRDMKERTGGGNLFFSKEFTPEDDEIAQITGDEKQVAAFKAILAEEIAKAKDLADSAQQGSRSQSSSAVGNYAEEVIVDAFYVGSLIGKAGSVLKEMEQSSGARISYSDRDASSVERTARIRGTPQQVQAAKKLITDKVHEVAQESRGDGNRRHFQSRGQSQGERRPRNRQPLPSDVKQVVEVPTECVGYLIGKGGRGLFNIQDQTQTRLDFAREDHRDGAREVTIYGPEDSVQKACDMIQQRVKESLDRKSDM